MKGHCCFAGCDPRACGCCFRAVFHAEDCPENPGVQLRAQREGRTVEEVVKEIQRELYPAFFAATDDEVTPDA